MYKSLIAVNCSCKKGEKTMRGASIKQVRQSIMYYRAYISSAILLAINTGARVSTITNIRLMDIKYDEVYR
jgi:hypothetical protein